MNLNSDLEKDIKTLKINKKIEKILKENKIITINDLCLKSRMELRELGIENNFINDILVKLQLIGLNLKQNHSKKNITLEKYICEHK